MDTTRRPVAVETAFARSIALPPPTTTSPSDPRAASATSPIRSEGTSRQRPAAGSSRCDHRSLATMNGCLMPISSSKPGSSARPQRTITWFVCIAISLSSTGKKAQLETNSEKVRSEEHTSELQSLAYLVCRLLLEKKKKNILQYVRDVHARNMLICSDYT